MDLLEILKRPEGKTLEFKRDLSSPAGALRTVVAFANTAGGTLVIGVEDKTRHVRGTSDPRGLEERIANTVSDSIEPRIVPDLEVLAWRGTHVVVLQVHPSPSRPHYLAKDGIDRGVYVRVGSTNRRADSELVLELGRFARGESYDERPMPDLDSEAVDFRAASESFSPVRKLRKTDLQTLQLVTTHQGRKVPTVGGVLLFGRDRERHFPDSWIQAGRFGGKNKANILDRKEIHRALLRSVEEAVAFVEKHSLHGAGFKGVRRVEKWSLPPVAVREAIVNAVVHADYSQRGAPIRVSIFDDRLEVENPGLLPFGLVVDDLFRGISKLRNRVLARVFHELGLIEHWGSGIQRMVSACAENGLAPPQLEEIGTRFRLTLFIEPTGRPALDDKDQAILAELAGKKGRSTSDIAKAIGLSTRATRTRLARLVDSGLVLEVGTSPQDPKRLYYRIEQE